MSPLQNSEWLDANNTTSSFPTNQYTRQDDQNSPFSYMYLYSSKFDFDLIWYLSEIIHWSRCSSCPDDMIIPILNPKWTSYENDNHVINKNIYFSISGLQLTY